MERQGMARMSSHHHRTSCGGFSATKKSERQPMPYGPLRACRTGRNTSERRAGGADVAPGAPPAFRKGFREGKVFFLCDHAHGTIVDMNSFLSCTSLAASLRATHLPRRTTGMSAPRAWRGRGAARAYPVASSKGFAPARCGISPQEGMSRSCFIPAPR